MGRCQAAAVGVMTIAAYVSVICSEVTAFLYCTSSRNSPLLLHRATAKRRRHGSLKGLHSCWALRRASPCSPTAAVVQQCPSSSNRLHVTNNDGAPLARLSATGDGGGGEESNALLLRMDFEHAEVQELREWIRRYAPIRQQQYSMQ